MIAYALRICTPPRCPHVPLHTEVVVATLRGDGNVLVPVDAAGRVLEVALLLEEFWAHEKWVGRVAACFGNWGSTIKK
eukprot:364553-Chlamydomonas_euryale.AAC.4